MKVHAVECHPCVTTVQGGRTTARAGFLSFRPGTSLQAPSRRLPSARRVEGRCRHQPPAAHPFRRGPPGPPHHPLNRGATMKTRWLLFAAACCALTAADWPQWRGPDRDGLSKETGLLKEWPKDGPKLA